MISSQAGLASIQPTTKPTLGGETMTITLNSAAFELRKSSDGHWYVIHALGMPTAQALVGQGFEPGRNPWEWDQGYAARIQKKLNEEISHE